MTATRMIDGALLPAPGTWKVDPGHAEVAFVGRHFMLTKVRGRFVDVDATVHIAEDPAASRVEAVIGMASVHSGDAARDEHLRSADFFDVERWPVATFESTSISWVGERGTLAGDLTIVGVTRPVVLEVRFAGHARDPWGNDRAVFEATGEIDRTDWGLTWNMLLETGGVVVSKEIRLELNVELVREP